MEKLLEDALVKLSAVVSGLFGVSGRAMLAALIAGERDPAALADLARGRLRTKTARLTEALTGRFTAHHAFLLTQMLRRVDAITADVATVQERIDAQIAPFARRWPDSMRSPASVPRRHKRSGPRSASTWPGSRPRRT